MNRLLLTAAGFVVGVVATLTGSAVHGVGPQSRPFIDQAPMTAANLHDCAPEPTGVLTWQTKEDVPSRFLCDNGRYELVVAPQPTTSQMLTLNAGSGAPVISSGQNWIVLNAPAVAAAAPTTVGP